MSFAYIATPGGKESLQLFGIAVAMFLEGGVVGIGIVVWCRDCYLVHVHDLVRVYGLVRICDVYLRLWGSGPVLALNREDS
jgi:hypothetical protein